MFGKALPNRTGNLIKWEKRTQGQVGEHYLVGTKEQSSVSENQETEERDICYQSQGRQGEIILDSNREAQLGHVYLCKCPDRFQF